VTTLTFMSTKKRQKRSKRLHIYLLNDKVNSFEYVIKVLMAICGQNAFQAEQCAMITHNTGQSHVYTGLGVHTILVYEALLKHGLDVELKTEKL
jgi:ATP-dependent Clp protease adaptor protein ClpS